MNIKNDIDLELLSIKEIAILSALAFDSVQSKDDTSIPKIIQRIARFYKDIDELQNVKQNYVLNFMRKLVEFGYVTKKELSPKKIYFKFTDKGNTLCQRAKICLQKLIRGYAGGIPDNRYRMLITDETTGETVEDTIIGESKTPIEIKVSEISQNQVMNFINNLSFFDKLEMIRYIQKTIDDDNRFINPSGEIEYR